MVKEALEHQFSLAEPNNTTIRLQLHQLLLFSCSASAFVSDLAFKTAQRLCSTLPMMILDKDILRISLEICHLLWKSCNDSEMDEVLFGRLKSF